MTQPSSKRMGMRGVSPRCQQRKALSTMLLADAVAQATEVDGTELARRCTRIKPTVTSPRQRRGTSLGEEHQLGHRPKSVVELYNDRISPLLPDAKRRPLITEAWR
jgi:hypothetical protein